jgi:hypothetical protein
LASFASFARDIPILLVAPLPRCLLRALLLRKLVCQAHRIIALIECHSEAQPKHLLFPTIGKADTSLSLSMTSSNAVSFFVGERKFIIHFVVKSATPQNQAGFIEAHRSA